MAKVILSEDELRGLRVKLQPRWGVSPRIYVSLLWGLLIAALVFTLFFLPEIHRNGRYYDFSSSPPGAAVYADEIRLGHTPGRYLVPAGTKTIRVRSPYNQDWEQPVKVKRRILGLPYLQRSQDFSISLKNGVDRKVLEESHRLVASWFLSDTGAEPLPPRIQELLQAHYNSGDSTALVGEEEIESYLLSLLRLARGEASFREWEAGMALYWGKGDARPFQDILQDARAGEKSMSLALRESLLAYQDLREGRTPLNPRRLQDIQIAQTLPPKRLRGMNFLHVGQTQGGQILYMAETEVSQALFDAFLRDNPGWSRGRLQELMAQGLVDENYLSYPEGGDPSLPARYISYYAARAFTSWLGEGVRLPTEWEWEKVAIANGVLREGLPPQGRLLPVGSGQRGVLGLYDMEGSLWEWCLNPYGVNDAFLPLLEEGFSSSFPHYAVRGGSWVNLGGEVLPSTRAHQPAQWATPFLGFRPVLVLAP